jgi:cell division protein FtsI (penicillin-binding protein 3)
MVLVNEPEAAIYGGVVAAPAFRNIASGALRQLAVPPRLPNGVPAAELVAFPSRHVERTDAAPKVDGNRSGAPDFLGLSLREAVEKARAIKVKVKMHGYGHVIKQQPLPGAAWNENRELVLNLQG